MKLKKQVLGSLYFAQMGTFSKNHDDEDDDLKK